MLAPAGLNAASQGPPRHREARHASSEAGLAMAGLAPVRSVGVRFGSKSNMARCRGTRLAKLRHDKLGQGFKRGVIALWFDGTGKGDAGYVVVWNKHDEEWSRVATHGPTCHGVVRNKPGELRLRLRGADRGWGLV